MKKRRKFASGEAPEAGQVWIWEGDDCRYYLVQRRPGYAWQGEMWDAINVTKGVVDQVFFRSVDKYIPFKRVA